MKTNSNRNQVLYCLIQFLYFTIQAATYGFASLYLLNKGFNNSQIGIFLAVASVCTIILQQFVASFVKKTNFSLNKLLIIFHIIIVILSLAIYALRFQGILFLILLVIIFFIVKASQPYITAIHQGYKEIQFSIARGIGSLGYSISNFLIGQLLLKVASDVLPIIYLILSILLIVCLIVFNAPNAQEEKQEVNRQEKINLLHDYPHFYLFLFGLMLIAVTHNFTELFLLQIIKRIGGTSANLGTASAISALTELPAMILYKKYYKKLGNRNLLMFSGIMWVLKNIFIAIAPNIYVVYAAEALQFLSFSIYVPSTERHLAHVIPKSEYLKGQALISTSLVIGSLIATLLGGLLIDTLGINTTLYIMQNFGVVGVIFFVISIRKSLKIIPRTK